MFNLLVDEWGVISDSWVHRRVAARANGWTLSKMAGFDEAWARP